MCNGWGQVCCVIRGGISLCNIEDRGGGSACVADSTETPPPDTVYQKYPMQNFEYMKTPTLDSMYKSINENLI
ncbi:hypothetical protein PP753_gp07 [Dinoroseobacter phage vB_DshP-R7L]|uniref:Uncharacterized protein n=1 Tax=Dinoroseobacter phage vB_DshP-R7L TaxID=2873349 RepID=A0AAE9BN05_9CAUD|nr:hypothetical protein PP753_gp07 [Dinoroseobacter phage vB_DshP-R7L]UAT28846.1 hypothetical protein R7L_gp7 [Dinoroseobacter phage vB_DshP-R7L]